MIINDKTKAMLASYGRSFLAAALAVWSTGNHDPKGLLAAGLAAVLPVAIRALNPKDQAFGTVAKLAIPEIEKQLTNLLAESNKKATAKKPAKKAAVKKKP